MHACKVHATLGSYKIEKKNYFPCWVECLKYIRIVFAVSIQLFVHMLNTIYIYYTYCTDASTFQILDICIAVCESSTLGPWMHIVQQKRYSHHIWNGSSDASHSAHIWAIWEHVMCYIFQFFSFTLECIFRDNCDQNVCLADFKLHFNRHTFFIHTCTHTHINRWKKKKNYFLLYIKWK